MATLLFSASADCSGTQVKIRCKSYKNEYLECPTGKTSPITKIWIKFLAAHSEECNYVAGSPPVDYPTDRPGIYGFGNDFVWVQNNCRATFYVCLAGRYTYRYIRAYYILHVFEVGTQSN